MSKYRSAARWWPLFLAVFGITSALISMSRAGAQVDPPQPAPITDYANYPANSGVAADCNVDDIHGIEYTVNDGAPVFDLGDIGPIHAGDILSVSWTDVSPECNTPPDLQPIVLSMKTSVGPTFDPAVNQYLELPYAIDFMGPMGGRITYELPNLLDDSYPGCFGQIDFILGLPLAVVGPDGSYYSLNQTKNMLIDAWNGEYDECVEPTVVTEPEPTPTTEAPAPTTTEALAPTTVAVQPVALQVAAAPVAVVEVQPAGQIATQVAGVRTLPKAELALTGPEWTPILVLSAITLIIGGMVGLIVSRRRMS